MRIILEPGDDIINLGREGFLVKERGLMWRSTTPLDYQNPNEYYKVRMEGSIDCLNYKGLRFEHVCFKKKKCF